MGQRGKKTRRKQGAPPRAPQGRPALAFASGLGVRGPWGSRTQPRGRGSSRRHGTVRGAGTVHQRGGRAGGGLTFPCDGGGVRGVTCKERGGELRVRPAPPQPPRPPRPGALSAGSSRVLRGPGPHGVGAAAPPRPASRACPRYGVPGNPETPRAAQVSRALRPCSSPRGVSRAEAAAAGPRAAPGPLVRSELRNSSRHLSAWGASFQKPAEQKAHG